MSNLIFQRPWENEESDPPLRLKQTIELAENVLDYTFGATWLESRLYNKKGEVYVHPVQDVWKHVVAINRKGFIHQRDLDAFQSISILGSFVAPLSYACLFPGFRGVLPRLMHVDGFSDAAFEVFVGGAYRHYGHDVEFVSQGTQHGLRQPDLRVINTTANMEMMVECKRKRVYIQQYLNKQRFSEICKCAINKVGFKHDVNVDIFVFSEFDYAHLQEALIDCLHFANNGFEGIFTSNHPGFGFSIYLDGKINAELMDFASGFFEITNLAGRFSCRLTCYLLQSIRWKSVLDSLKTAAKQFHPTGTNVVAIEVTLQPNLYGHSIDHAIAYGNILGRAAEVLWYPFTGFVPCAERLERLIF